jgi:hypothetical protein
VPNRPNEKQPRTTAVNGRAILASLFGSALALDGGDS